MSAFSHTVKCLLAPRLVPASLMISLAAASVLGACGVARAGVSVPVATLTSLPPPDANAFSTAFRYNSQGILFAWDGFNVWQQNGVNADAFTPIGTVVGAINEPADWLGQPGPYNCADAGPINFSADGQRILLGNGNGGYAPYGGPDYSGTVESQFSGQIWSMPVTGSTPASGTVSAPVGNIPYHDDFLPLPAASTIADKANMYFVNQGNASYTGSSISVFDETTGQNVTVINNGPGATTSLAFNPQNNRLYGGVGWGRTAAISTRSAWANSTRRF